MLPLRHRTVAHHTVDVYGDTDPPCIMICMRTTLNIDDSLLKHAARLTGVSEKTTLIRLGLEALIARESARRLAALGGSESRLRDVPRRRSKA